MSGGAMAGDEQSETSGEQRPLISLAVRGGSLDLFPDQIIFGLAIYPLVDLLQAALVPSPAGAPGALTHGMLLRTRDGRAPLLIPEDTAEAERFLDMIYVSRPDLRQSPPQFSPLYPPHYPGYPAQPTHVSGIPQHERVWAMLSHLSVFFIPLWFPLIVWLVTQQTMPYASRQAKQAFFFHLLILALVSVVIIPAWVVLVIGGLGLATASESIGIHAGRATISSLVCGGALMIALAVALSIYGVYGAVQAFVGKPFHYPLLRRL